MTRPLYTIGHSNHSLERFLELLRTHEITTVCDVRSQPSSRYSPQFNRAGLECALREARIRYGFLGKELGARPEDPTCYRNGKVVYGLLAQTTLFKDGIERLRKGMETQRIALMCAEKDPLTCHRTILICRQLRSDDIEISHILETNDLEKHQDAEMRLLELTGTIHPSLFDTMEELLERAYDAQADRIAYVEKAEHDNAAISDVMYHD